MLRISEERQGEILVVRVAGRLAGEGVDTLSRACRDAGGGLRLDLAGVMQADEVGLALVRSLRDAGAELSGVSPFVQMLLDSRASGSP